MERRASRCGTLVETSLPLSSCRLGAAGPAPNWLSSTNLQLPAHAAQRDQGNLGPTLTTPHYYLLPAQPASRSRT